ncbi:MAG: hypothetical protein AAF078_01935 [Planctomycetota bacterium]
MTPTLSDPQIAQMDTDSLLSWGGRLRKALAFVLLMLIGAGAGTMFGVTLTAIAGSGEPLSWAQLVTSVAAGAATGALLGMIAAYFTFKLAGNLNQSVQSAKSVDNNPER